MKRKVLLIFILSLGVLYILITNLSKLNNFSNVSTLQSENILPMGSQKVDYHYSAWAPSWATEAEVLLSLEASQNKLETLLPSWYLLSSSGRLVSQEPSYKTKILDFTSQNQTKVLPTIENQFDPKRVSIILESQTLQTQFAQRLVKLAEDNNYIGWDLDWEQIDQKDATKFSEFVSYLNDFLDQNDLILSVSVHAQTGTSSDWDKSHGHDYHALGKAADFIRIMAYDFHHAGSNPGPVTPPDNLRQVLGYAQKNIPQHKIILGLPTYGYSWTDKGGEGVQYNEIIKRINQNKGQFKKDQPSMALNGSYVQGSINHQIWFEDASTIKLKADIASREFGVSNFCFWRLGGEDPNIWQEE